MRNMICLLLMTAFIGCHPTHTETPEPGATKRPDVPAPKLDHKVFTGDLDVEAFAESAPTLEMRVHEDESGDLPEMRYVCVATGKFNLAPDRLSLDMETMCVGGVDDSKVVRHVEDQKALRANSHFNIPFESKARVTIKEGKKPTLELRYVGSEGGEKAIPLTPRPYKTRYQFSFADLVPDEIAPDGEYRTM